MSLLLRAVVAVRREGQRRDDGGARLVAHDQPHRAARAGVARGDIAHGDRAADGRPEAPAGDLAERAAVLRRDPGVLARRRLAVGLEADALARRALGELFEDDGGARE